MSRFRLVKMMQVNQPETDFILTLARAGMSYSCIAKEVYGESTESGIRRIGYILAWEGVKVTDFRNARNSLGRAMVSAIRREADILSAIRVASNRAAAAIRKTA